MNKFVFGLQRTLIMNLLRKVISSLVLLNVLETYVGGADETNIIGDDKSNNKRHKNESNISFPPLKTVDCSTKNPIIENCPSELECSSLGNECLICYCSLDCKYGETSSASCQVPDGINCSGPKTFNRNYSCSYCYQSDGNLHTCEDNTDCDSIKERVVSNCTVDPSVICLGRRHFYKQQPCKPPFAIT